MTAHPVREETVPITVTAVRAQTVPITVTAQAGRPPLPSAAITVRELLPVSAATIVTAVRPEAQGPVSRAASVLRDRARDRPVTGREHPSVRDVPVRLLPTGLPQDAGPQAEEALLLPTAAS